MAANERLITDSFKSVKNPRNLTPSKKTKRQRNPKRASPDSPSYCQTSKLFKRSQENRYSCRTPVRNASSTPTISSPESQILLSQIDTHSYVTWDYGSSASKHNIEEVKSPNAETIKARTDIKELLMCIDQSKLQPCMSQASTFIKLVDKWVSREKKVDEDGAQKVKKTRRVLRDMKSTKLLKKLFDDVNQDSTFSEESKRMPCECTEKGACDTVNLQQGLVSKNLSDEESCESTNENAIFLEVTQVYDRSAFTYRSTCNDKINVTNQQTSPGRHNDKAVKNGCSSQVLSQCKLFDNDTASALETKQCLLVTATQTQNSGDTWDDSLFDELLSSIPEEELILGSQKIEDTKEASNNIDAKKHANEMSIIGTCNHSRPNSTAKISNNGHALPTNHTSLSFELCSTSQDRICIPNFYVNSAIGVENPEIQRSSHLNRNQASNGRATGQHFRFSNNLISKKGSPVEQAIHTHRNVSSQRYTAAEIAKKKEEALKKRAQRMAQAAKMVKFPHRIPKKLYSKA